MTDAAPRPQYNALPIAILLGVSGLAALIAIPLLRGGIGHALLVLAALLVACLAGFALLVLGGSAAVEELRRGPSARPVGRPARISVFLLALLVACAFWPVSYYGGHRLAARDVRRAKAFCESLISQIDAAVESTGSYPKSIDEFIGDRDRPRALRGGHFYGSDEEHYWFSVFERGKFMFSDVHHWNSNERTWIRIVD